MLNQGRVIEVPNRKIDEPKTPYVRYDAERDIVLGGMSAETHCPEYELSDT